MKHYIHRVGRTARAGKGGRSVSIIGEGDRKLFKEIVKKARHPVKNRILPPGTVLLLQYKFQNIFPLAKVSFAKGKMLGAGTHPTGPVWGE